MCVMDAASFQALLTDIGFQVTVSASSWSRCFAFGRQWGSLHHTGAGSVPGERGVCAVLWVRGGEGRELGEGGGVPGGCLSRLRPAQALGAAVLTDIVTLCSFCYNCKTFWAQVMHVHVAHPDSGR